MNDPFPAPDDPPPLPSEDAVTRDRVALVPGLVVWHVAPVGTPLPGVVTRGVVDALRDPPHLTSVLVCLVGQRVLVYPWDCFAAESAALAEARRLVEQRCAELDEQLQAHRLRHGDIVARQIEVNRLYPFPLSEECNVA